MKIRKKIFIPFFIFTLLLSSFFLYGGGKEFYRSNELAMTLEKINPVETALHVYVVTLEQKEGQKEKVLLYKGEIKESEVSYFAGRVLVKKDFFSKSEKQKTIFYDSTEKIREIWYYQDGLMEKKEIYKYISKVLKEIATYDVKGNLIKNIIYERDDKGRLQRVDFLQEEKNRQSGYVYSGEEIIAERHEEIGEREDEFYYDSFGRKKKIVSFISSRKVEEISFTYPSDNKIIKEIINYENSKKIKEILIGNLLVEKTTSKDGLFFELLRFEYDENNNIIVKNRRTSGMRESWEYHYNNKDTLVEEVYMVNESIQKVIQYGEEDKRTEILYRKGNPFLEVIYKDNEKIGEHFLSSWENEEN